MMPPTLRYACTPHRAMLDRRSPTLAVPAYRFFPSSPFCTMYHCPFLSCGGDTGREGCREPCVRDDGGGQGRVGSGRRVQPGTIEQGPHLLPLANLACARACQKSRDRLALLIRLDQDIVRDQAADRAREGDDGRPERRAEVGRELVEVKGLVSKVELRLKVERKLVGCLADAHVGCQVGGERGQPAEDGHVERQPFGQVGVLHLNRHRLVLLRMPQLGQVHLPDGARRQRRLLKALKQGIHRLAERSLDGLTRAGEGVRRRAVGQGAQRLAKIVLEQVVPRGGPLTPLDPDRPAPR
eukprot:scaffold32519_cov114-Isochrysis_galbana.AAC.2